jgi:hypothetical protein
MAQFIAVIKRDLDRFKEEEFAPLLEPEAERLRALYASGLVRAAWGRKDCPGAVLLIEAPTLDEARAGINSLPLLERGMLVLEQFFEMGPYRGFTPRG